MCTSLHLLILFSSLLSSHLFSSLLILSRYDSSLLHSSIDTHRLFPFLHTLYLNLSQKKGTTSSQSPLFTTIYQQLVPFFSAIHPPTLTKREQPPRNQIYLLPSTSRLFLFYYKFSAFFVKKGTTSCVCRNIVVPLRAEKKLSHEYQDY